MDKKQFVRFLNFKFYVYILVGYNYDEMSIKSQSLRGVLEPFSTNGNLGLLKRAGFKDILIIFKYICFEGYLAIK